MIQNVLVTAVGGIVAQGIIKSLKLANNRSGSSLRYSITGTDLSPLAAGLYRCDHGKLVPAARSPDFIDELVNVCREYDISAIFVGSDEELLTIAKAKSEIESLSGAKVLLGPENVITIARDKWQTFQFCRNKKIPHAASALPDDREAFLKEFGFPVVVKPREGYGSVHFYVAANNEEVNLTLSAIERSGWHPILQEYLRGDEFTTGVTVSLKSGDIMSSIVTRKIIKHGQTYKAFVEDSSVVRKLAERCAQETNITGAINVQSILVRDDPVVFEFNPRFSASCAMRAMAGINEPDIVYRNFVLGEELKVMDHVQLVCMRYWNEVYVPLQQYHRLENERVIHKSDGFSILPDYF